MGSLGIWVGVTDMTKDPRIYVYDRLSWHILKNLQFLYIIDFIYLVLAQQHVLNLNGKGS